MTAAGDELPGAVTTETSEETAALAAELARALRPGDVVLLEGEMGAGKTTFVRAAAQALGIDVPITSPTFTLAHRYEGDPPVAHLDLHRLDSLEGEDPAFLADYVGPDSVAFVEWPGAGEPELAPQVTWRVTLAHAGGDRRTVSLARVST